MRSYFNRSYHRRLFSGVSIRSPKVLVAKNGDVVVAPPNAMSQYNYPIAKVGLDAVMQFLPEHTDADRLRNQAQFRYLELRNTLLKDHKEKWLATCSNGSMFVGNHEAVVRSVAAKYFYSKDEDFFVDCLGCEVLMGISMDGASSVGDEECEDHGLYFDLDFSADDGASFQQYRVKHGTGAYMLGVPQSVLSQYSLSEKRGPDAWIMGATSSKPVKCNVYRNLQIRAFGGTINLDVVTARDWLFGYNAYKHFLHDIDCDRVPKLIMKPKVPDAIK